MAVESPEFTISTMRDHAMKKGMWAGGLTSVLIPELLGVKTEEDEDKNQKLKLFDITRAHTPALLKIFDEIIVNATDHVKGNEKTNHRVTQIDITFDIQNGKFSVYNDGPGIPVNIHAEASKIAGHSVYVPEVAFAHFLAGTNIDKDLSNVKGGINGLGAKLANVHSLEFNVETVDEATNKFYMQQWKNRLNERRDPIIVDIKKKKCPLTALQIKPHTKISFIPAYAELGYKLVVNDLSKINTLSKVDTDDIDAWLHLRACQAAAYVGPRVAVTYNTQKCLTTDVTALGHLLLTLYGTDIGQSLILQTQAKSTVEPFKQHPWNIAVIILPPGKKTGRRAGAQNMTIVNGVLSNKGSHIQYIKKILSTAVEEKLRKATKRGKTATTDNKKMSITETLAGVRLVMCGAIPGADWSGQRKDELQLSKETLEHYNLSATFLKQAADAIAERILISQGVTTHGKVVHDKYTKARNSGKALHKHNTYLMAAEGDSAITLLRAGLTQSRKATLPGGPSFDWCGIISLQGVIVNAAREVTSMETSEGDTINIRSNKLQNNKRLLALADALGLQYNKTYTTAEELSTLNYGQLLLCVDQDLDGTGKIAALVLVWIYLFWPALIKAGRIGRLMTPLVRAYEKNNTKKAPHEFFYEEELHRWISEDMTRTSTHTIKYYKGLATHDEDEVKRMFAPLSFKSSIYTYTMDDTADKLFDVYFGANSNLRKEELITPVQHLSYLEALNLHNCRQIPVGRVQLDVDTKSYKNDAIKRQLSGGPDGLNPARRKILMGAMLRFSGESSAKELKIFQLGGYVADKCFYHHGDASLSSTIIYLAQSYAGARKYPYLIGVGQFGSRHGDKAGSARYISVKLSPLVKATFPPADRWHLPYIFEDGERAEPQYFIPVVPMTALESYRIVSEGWNHDSYGRDIDSVLAIVNAYINGDEILTTTADKIHNGFTADIAAECKKISALWPLPASTRGFDGNVRNYKGEDYSFGTYTWNVKKRMITITELPMGVTTIKYLETLSKVGRSGKVNPRDEFIDTIVDKSTSDKVELEIILRDGAFDRITEEFGDEGIDPIEDVLMLRTSLRPHLNYYGANGEVLEFGECYLTSILYWAPLRRNLYIQRITRKCIVAELRILEESEILKYISMAVTLDIASIQDDDAANIILKNNGFQTLDTGLLHRPEYTSNNELKNLILSGKNASYDYILNLKERDLVKKAADIRHKRILSLRSELDILNAQLSEKPVACASLWRAEIAEFINTVNHGLKTSWKFKAI